MKQFRGNNNKENPSYCFPMYLKRVNKKESVVLYAFKLQKQVASPDKKSVGIYTSRNITTPLSKLLDNFRTDHRKRNGKMPRKTLFVLLKYLWPMVFAVSMLSTLTLAFGYRDDLLTNLSSIGIKQEVANPIIAWLYPPAVVGVLLLLVLPSRAGSFWMILAGVGTSSFIAAAINCWYSWKFYPIVSAQIVLPAIILSILAIASSWFWILFVNSQMDTVSSTD